MMDALVPNDATDPVEVIGSRVPLKNKICLILRKKFDDCFDVHRGQIDAAFEEIKYFEDLNDCLVEQLIDKYSFPSSNTVETMICTMFVLIELVHPPRGSFDHIAHPAHLTAFKHIARASLSIFPRRQDSFHMKIGGILEHPEFAIEFSAPKSKMTPEQIERCDYNQRKRLVHAMSASQAAAAAPIRFATLSDMMSYHTQRSSCKTPLTQASLILVDRLPVSSSAENLAEVLNDTNEVRHLFYQKDLVELLREPSEKLLQSRLNSVAPEVAERFDLVVEAVKSRFPHQWYFDILVPPTLASLILPVIEGCFANDRDKLKQPSEIDALQEDFMVLFAECGVLLSEDIKNQIDKRYRKAIVNALQFGYFFALFCHHIDNGAPGVTDDKDGGKLYVLYPTARAFEAAHPHSSNLYAFQSMLSIFMGYRSKERAIKGQCMEMCMRLDDRVFHRGGGKSSERIAREEFFHAVTGIEETEKRGRGVCDERSPTPNPIDGVNPFPSPSKRACQPNSKVRPSAKSPRTLKRSSPNPFPPFESIECIQTKENPVDNRSRLELPTSVSASKRTPLLELPTRSDFGNVPVTPRNSEQKRLTRTLSTSSSSSTSAFSSVKKSSSKAKATAPKSNRQGATGMESTFMSPVPAIPTSTEHTIPQQATPMAVEESPTEYVTKRVGFLPSESWIHHVDDPAQAHGSAAAMDTDGEMSELPDEWEGSVLPLRVLESETQFLNEGVEGAVGYDEGTVVPFPISTPTDEYPLRQDGVTDSVEALQYPFPCW